MELLAKTKGLEFPKKVKKSKNEKIFYVRGFFDAEGGIPNNLRNRFYIQLVQKDKKKLEKIKAILIDLKIAVGEIHNPSKKVDPCYWRMFIKTASHKKFIELIGSWHPKKIRLLKERVMI
ncbi:hypothetical protein COU05_00740 [bacterium (Candidatus Gribaldobacteria) CG10_big_fil_rev_8_21_14_0_10_37_21]|uniref:Homing endonuclease LAGLIDADG domain-containing protein n=1 Tax=bacterium (Candidatus Gribaldobacteria) CG10_big_fil_rev_8_21_14_0_10_37_21 TaxID=2014275 RepID=A0A2H0UUZ7_9BACT|nr:MAG: hypothetical protein AUJ25_02480 [Parcubacteria group bacterium CG1_02_37_13]PIR90686.1 MAG: hypothetical protein COU05_00740 [bacterium (Candidatus Gribaldobacteria) CG10_big_fil_rev_8_21_14_0_10_37_21]